MSEQLQPYSFPPSECPACGGRAPIEAATNTRASTPFRPFYNAAGEPPHIVWTCSVCCYSYSTAPKMDSVKGAEQMVRVP